MDDSTTTPAHELTRNPVDGTWGFICREHGIHRAGLTEPHALNVERKHLREEHAAGPVPTLDLAPLARLLMDARRSAGILRPTALHAPAQMALATMEEAWTALTGLTGQEAVEYAATVATQATVRVAVVPF